MWKKNKIGHKKDIKQKGSKKIPLTTKDQTCMCLYYGGITDDDISHILPTMTKVSQADIHGDDSILS